ncbi:MAG: hypothetical protein HUJ98_13005, partial [Bacteroidaceae bacterium]|nr:hypothetical protein [Bacteroidaceae bacterium]
MLMLLAVAYSLTASADNFFWRDGNVTVTSNGSNTVTLKYLTYDFEGSLFSPDDYLKELFISVVGSGAQEWILRHDGGKEGTTNFYDGYGKDSNYNNSYNKSFSVKNMKKSNDGNKYYRQFDIVFPNCYYGKLKLKFECTWAHSESDIRSYTVTKDITLGSQPACNPSFSSLVLTSPTNLQVTMAGMPKWEQANTDVTFTIAQGSLSTSQKFSYDKNQTPATVFNFTLPAGTDISKDINVKAQFNIWRKAEEKANYALSVDFKRDISKTHTGFAFASNQSARFNLSECLMDVTWTANKLSNSTAPDFVSLFCRVDGGTWKLLAGNMAKNTQKFTHTAKDDNVPLMPDKSYEYRIVYGRTAWGNPSVNNNWGGIAATEPVTTATSGLKPRLSTSREQSAIRLDWEIPNSSELLNKKCDIIIQRALSTSTKFVNVDTVKYLSGGT